MDIKGLVVGAMETNCYLVSSGNELAVIDPGDEAEMIISKIEARKVLKYIIYTHCHFDHVSAGNQIKRSLGGETLIHFREKELFSGLKIDRYLEGGETLKIEDEILRVLHNPGHTPGSISLLGNNFIMTGDTLFKDGIGRTDLLGGSPEDMERSLEKIYEMISPGMRIYPGHGPDFVSNKF